MQMTNTQNHFGIFSIVLHWGMACLLIGLLILGIYMVNLPVGLWKLKLYGWHKEYGMVALMLVLLRLIWRLSNATPQLTSLSYGERVAARFVHWSFYFFMFALPITGWLLTSAAGLPVSFFGLFVLPDLIFASEEQMQLLQAIHKWLGYGLIGFIILHTGAALKHHFINKDDILRRML